MRQIIICFSFARGPSASLVTQRRRTAIGARRALALAVGVWLLDQIMPPRDRLGGLARVLGLPLPAYGCHPAERAWPAPISVVRFDRWA